MILDYYFIAHASNVSILLIPACGPMPFLSMRPRLVEQSLKDVALAQNKRKWIEMEKFRRIRKAIKCALMCYRDGGVAAVNIAYPVFDTILEGKKFLITGGSK